jgi:DNA-binding NtrC family response regulator
MNLQAKKILLIDLEDSRRASGVLVLEQAGYEVFLRTDWHADELSDRENGCDLVLIALHDDPEQALAYAEGLARRIPDLPVLLLSDTGVF